jgi:DNA phosphorothioation-associated putative methyltransferase
MLDEAYEMATVGRLTDRALYLHSSALPKLPPLLRVYEGSARAYVGTVDGANVVKLHRLKPAVTYMSYADFDGDPHPELTNSLRVELHTFDIKIRDFADWPDAPILYKKDELVAEDHPSHRKFSRLSAQEDRWGL